MATTGPAEVVVLGYTREPYLRIKAGVVEENQLSQTTYLNRSLFADSVPTGQDSGGLAPAWKQIGSTGVVRWHDHRIHWMGQERPPAVRADPRHPHPVGTWTVHATVSGSPFEIRGTLRWLGKPASASGIQAIPEWVLWVVEALTVVLGGLSLGVMARRQRRASCQPAPNRLYPPTRYCKPPNSMAGAARPGCDGATTGYDMMGHGRTE